MTPHERASAAYNSLPANRTVAFSMDGVTIRAHGFSLDGKSLACTIEAQRGGTSLPVDNPYTFVNPPLMVPDGEGFRHDPLEAVKRMLYDAVVGGRG